MKTKLVPKLKDLDIFLNSDDEVMLFADAIKKLGDDKSDHFATGFTKFNDVLNGGFKDGDLVIIAGKTGMGKTTLCQTFTYYLNKEAIPCLWFSYEVSIREVWKKFINMGIDKNFLAYTPFKTTTGKVDWIENKIKEGILKFNTKAIFIDHLGFLMPSVEYDKDYSRNYSAYLGLICRQLKQIAIKYNIIVFVCAHLRKTDDPNIDDLRDSSAIAQEADTVFIVNRMKKRNKFNLDNEGEIYSNDTKISIEKNRETGKNKFIKCLFSNGKFNEIIYDKNPEPTDYLNK